MNIKTFIFTVLIVCVCSCVVEADEVVLIQNGKPMASIVVGETPSDQSLEAAKELQHFLKLITGVELSLVNNPSQARGIKVLVGQSAATAAAKRIGLSIPSGLTYQYNEEGYVVYADNNTVILAGNETAPYEGTFYAVYDFLDGLGCRWFFPGKFGQVVPKLDTIAIKSDKRLVKPEFRIREVWAAGFAHSPTEQEAVDYDIWNRRNRMVRPDFYSNPAVKPYAKYLHNPCDDTTYRLLPKEKYWTSHPEYYALNADGSRNERFICASNPGAIQAAIDTIIEFFNKNPASYSFGFSPPDYPVLCHCQSCKKAMNKGFNKEGYGEISDYYFDFVFKVADAVVKVYPDRWIISMAYYNRCRPPVTVTGKHRNVVIQLANIQQCSLHSYVDDNCWSCKQFGAMARQWAELTAGVIYYRYDPHDWTQMYRPVWRGPGIAKDLRLLKQLGGWGYANEGQLAFLSTGLNYYIRAKLAWDLNQDVRDMEQDFFDRFFGPSAVSMSRYYIAIEDALDESKVCFYGGRQTADEVFAALPRQMLDRCQKLLDKAGEQAKQEPFRSRVTAFRTQYDRLDAYEKYRSAMVRADYKAAVKWCEEMTKAAQRAGNKVLIVAGDADRGLSEKKLSTIARRIGQWTDGTKRRLVAVMEPSAVFRTDPAMEGVIYRWYLSENNKQGWFKIPLTTSWHNIGVLTPEGRQYKGIGWYRGQVNLTEQPPEKAGLFIPELRGSDIWVWCNGKFAGHVEKKSNEDIIIELTGMLKSGRNSLCFRINGDGGLTLPPFVFDSME